MVGVKLNGAPIDLSENSKIRITMQVSDIADISTVNATYSNQFTAPVTPNNVELLDYLGYVGSGSRRPYELIGAEVDIDGATILTNGILNITKTTENYSLSIQEGIVSFFKILEGMEFGNGVDISELNHIKNLDAVVNSFSNPYYTYLISDYGGRTQRQTSPLNPPFTDIDFLVPSAKVSYLFDKLVEATGYTWDGFFKNLNDFKDAYITYPTTNSEQEEISVLDLEKPQTNGKFWWLESNTRMIYLFNSASNPWDVLGVPDYTSATPMAVPGRLYPIKIRETDNYSIKIDFNFSGTYKFYRPFINLELIDGMVLSVRKNGNEIMQVIGGEPKELNLPLMEDDEISFEILTLTRQEVFLRNGYPPNMTGWLFEGIENEGNLDLTVSLNSISFENTDFADGFQDFKPTDLVKEIMIRFGAVPFVDNVNRHVEFKSVDDLINYDKGFEDWTDFISERKSESYTIGKYGQTNYYRHKYNLEGDDYADAKFEIGDLTLGAEHDVWKSKIYAPSQSLARIRLFAGGSITVMPTPLWEVEVKDNNGEPEIDYKELSNRFYWLKSKGDNRSIVLFSSFLGNIQVVQGFKYADTGQTTYDYFIPKYNQGNITLLNDVRVHEFTATLDLIKVLNIDFSKPIYIGQEASYYKLNRIVFEDEKEATIEAIKIRK